MRILVVLAHPLEESFAASVAATVCRKAHLARVEALIGRI